MRRRLFRHLDAATDKPIVWICSPAGSGKTTLVSSYLQERKRPCLWLHCDEGDGDPATFFHYLAIAAHQMQRRRLKPLPVLMPEYLSDLPTFTQRFFRELCDRLAPPYLLIFDNYQKVPAGAVVHEVLAQALETLPAGVTMVFLSREEPPPPLAQPGAYGRMASIGWHDLRFTLEETIAVARAGRRRMSKGVVLDLHQKADGWIAAIVLMMGRARLDRIAEAGSGAVGSERLFDYFAGEVLGKHDPATRAFLLKTSFLSTVSVPLADRMFGRKNAGTILAALERQNCFTQRMSGGSQEYQYHPLFRASLMARARAEICPNELTASLQRAAEVLGEAGRTEEAAELSAGIGYWEGLADLMLSAARELILAGRHLTLEGFLRRLPVERLDADPRLLYWLGICRMPFDLGESRNFLDRAFRAFDGRSDIDWTFAAWAAVVDSIITEHNDYTLLDPWLEWMDAHDALVESLPPDIRRETAAYMLFALTFRKPSDPKIGRWRERAEDLVRNSHDLTGAMIVGARLLLHYTFFGEVRKAGFMLERVAPPGVEAAGLRMLPLIQWQVITAAFHALGSGSAVACGEAVRSGLALSLKHGIHFFEPLLLYFGAAACVPIGEDAEADEYLDRMLSLKGDFNEMQAAYFLSILAWRDLVRGDARGAAERIEMILPLTERFGYSINTIANRIGLAQALFDLGEVAEARQHLAGVRALHLMDSPWVEYLLLTTEAYFAFREGSEEEGMERTRRAMAIGRRRGVSIFVYWRPAVLALLCSKALEHGIEPDHVKGLIRKYRLEPDETATESDRWPWPIRVYTLGSFRIELDGAPLEFKGKVPQKPLELLKALIAFGGREVPEERLIDALWPEADGDLAGQSLEVTIRRLRGLLRREDCIRHQARTLSLDRHGCWVDSLALEAILKRGLDGGSEAGCIPCHRLSEMYQGPFLPGDNDREWVAARQETLISLMIQMVEKAGNEEESAGNWEQAAACYRKGLELDDLKESFYRRLMTCWIRLGKRSDAANVYRRCRQQLHTHLGIVPSKETESLFASLSK